MWSVFFLQIGQHIKSCIKWHSQQWPNATLTMVAALVYICLCHQIASATRLSMKRMMNINTKSCCCAQIVWTKSNETKASRVSQAQIPRDSPSESQASTFFVFSPLFLNILTQHFLRTNVHISYIFLNPNSKSCMPVHLFLHTNPITSLSRRRHGSAHPGLDVGKKASTNYVC